MARVKRDLTFKKRPPTGLELERELMETLGSLLATRFSILTETRDIDEAITLTRMSLSLATTSDPEEVPDLGSTLNSLSIYSDILN